MDRQGIEPRQRHVAGRRAWRSATTVLAVLLAWQVAPASAAPQHNPKGRFLGVVKSARASARPTPQAQTQTQLAAGNLTYHQGPVMHSNRAHAIYWEPAGFSTTSTYKALINTYLGDVAADSAKHTNVYASDVQYTDTTGRAAYSSSFAGAVTATDAYPASACADTGRSVCLTDAQIQAEVDHVVAANGLPRGLGDIYFVMTPPGVGSCFDSGSTSCAYTDYCAYHSNFDSAAGQTLYANQPYSGDPGCDSGEQPNGDVADSTTNLISHEHNETITDPLGTGWYDRLGNENGDKCAWNFGGALGSTGTGSYNQLINGRDYYLQQEWSNASSGCVLTMANQAPTASFTSSPASPATGQTVSFDGTGSSGTVTGYSWDFGDGTPAGVGAKPSHTYASPGTYSVRLTVTDDSGNTDAVTHAISVTQPSSGVSPSGTAGGGASAGTAGASTLPIAPAGSSLGSLPASGARLLIPSQSLRVSAARAARVLLRCTSRQRCDGMLAIAVTIQVPVRGGHRSRTVVLGRARVSIAALHSAHVSVRLSHLAASLLRSHPRVRARVAAAVRGAASGHASVTRSVWLLPAVPRRR